MTPLFRTGLQLLLCASVLGHTTAATDITPSDPAPPARWKNGPPTDPGFFPIAVWLQDPRNAPRYRAAGINVYVGLWRGPTEKQLADLEKAGVKVICEQNRVGLAHRDSPAIIGWMHGDEPDNAQALPGRQGYGPPIVPQKIITDYARIREADPTRPVLLNLGQGVAWDNYIGRGVRRNHPEDYAEYVKGADLVSFDIYPAAHESTEILGKLEYVAYGVQRLVAWAGPERTVWNCIECTLISNPPRKPTPAQVRSEVWMSLIQGSRGLIYFVHQFQPTFNEAALLADPAMLEEVTRVNRQITELAPVLNSPTWTNQVQVKLQEGVDVQPDGGGALDLPPVACMAKQLGGTNYIFTVSLRNQPCQARLALASGSSGTLEVIGEGRSVSLSQGRWVDSYQPYEVHLYRGKPVR